MLEGRSGKGVSVELAAYAEAVGAIRVAQANAAAAPMSTLPALGI